MNAKQFLSQSYRLAEQIESHKRELAELREMMPVISSSSFSDTPNSGSRILEPSFAKMTVRIVDLERKVAQEIDTLCDVKLKIHYAIEAVPDVSQRLLLRLKYIEGLSWQDVADRLHYSVKHAFKIHQEALQKVVVPNDDTK